MASSKRTPKDLIGYPQHVHKWVYISVPFSQQGYVKICSECEDKYK